MSKPLRGDLSGLPQQGLVVVGFSGGADSTALAHWLMGQVDPDRLVLAHVNHQLRGEEAERDEAAARQFAGRFGLRFAVFREDVAALAKREGLGLEECGRQVRYRFFHSLASGEEDRILTAHNANDNAETVLEISDLLYHLTVLMVNEGIALEDVRAELDRRHGKTGNLKKFHQVDKNT